MTKNDPRDNMTNKALNVLYHLDLAGLQYSDSPIPGLNIPGIKKFIGDQDPVAAFWSVPRCGEITATNIVSYLRRRGIVEMKTQRPLTATQEVKRLRAILKRHKINHVTGKKMK